ncbi:TPA: outer membrane lipoprotein chaperone LolA [Aeromonas salmonicida]|uniref:outer membrane lipoprotein chaperone LolA n=1 Tax=Aeromonas salmonicida TaxID=645 RepID=UPI0005A7F41A|nr:outer membrane lipoprotein chaperone LolA [Aeromonas salmonicida]ASI23720.1 outer membrane lipoprotein carrier protein LolA [Aeromonas salmonicida]ASI28039.1 outer membrane lipoprotein carrier protein LolA [Aeromonas salmonicida]ASI32171.1 outer membrane lipoprotein carrier protein LolA [Aeromonas salmonicida]ELI6404990.1 outer membrane lipoprotein chaperone LolA [Aeromonas salmonicida subsp. salmonicida]ELI6417209.1 outer membrane lipoprotein chaperone LolA [Aeromonas salmonicida subsp. sa
MKKQLLIGSVLLVASSQVWADAASSLKQKLADVSLFSAKFAQTVYDSKGKELQKAGGDLLVQRPNRFNWHTTSPDESLIVADGKDVWVYDPFVEQVTALKLKDAVLNTPFILIAGNDDKFWKHYDVTQEGNVYTVTSRNKDELIASFRVTFDRQNNISRFDVKEAQGQWSEFTLSSFNRKPVLKGNEFVFKIPKGGELDDQR